MGLAIDDETLPLDEDWSYLFDAHMRFRCFQDHTTYDLREYGYSMSDMIEIVQGQAEGLHRSALAAEESK